MKNLIVRGWNSPTIMTWVALIIRSGGFFILLPLVLSSFSTETTSVWLLFFSVATLMFLADSGFSQTFSREVSYGFSGASLEELYGTESRRLGAKPTLATGSPNWHSISLIHSAMVWVYLRLALGVLLLGATVGTYSVLGPILQLSESREAFVAWSLVVVGSAIYVYSFSLNAFLLGANKIVLQKRWEALFNLVGVLAQITVLVIGGGLLEIVLVAQLQILLQTIVYSHEIRKLLRGSSQRFVATEKKKIIRELFPAVWRTAVGIFSGQGAMQGVLVYMVNVLPAPQAASLQLGIRVVQTVCQYSQVPFYSKIPRLNELRAKQELHALNSVSHQSISTSLWIFAATAMLAGLVAPPLLEMVGSKTEFVSPIQWLLLTLAFFVERYSAMMLQVFTTTRVIVLHIVNGVTAVLWVGMVIAWPFGPVEVAYPVTMVVAHLVFYAWYAPLVSYRSLNLDFSEVRRRIFSHFMPGVAAIVVLYFLFIWFRESQWLLFE